MKSRNGKIARLPHDVREELNIRLERSERSPKLLAWLNALPAVQAFVQQEFGGESVSKHNLSRWRLGGFQDWLTRRDFFAQAQNTGDFVTERVENYQEPLADQAAEVLAAHYARLLGRWNGECTRDFEAGARVLNGLCRGVAKLHREAPKASRDNFALEKPRETKDPGQGPSQCVALSCSDKLAEKVGTASAEA
jgi:hypothetical protein